MLHASSSPSVSRAATSISRHLVLTVSVVTGAGGKEVTLGGPVGLVGVGGRSSEDFELWRRGNRGQGVTGGAMHSG